MKQKYILNLIVLLLILVTNAFSNTGIILGDFQHNPCSERKYVTNKVDNGIIYTFTGIIYTFTGVIYTAVDIEENNTPENCGIIISD